MATPPLPVGPEIFQNHIPNNMAAEGGLGVLDADDLIDEIIAKKGVHKYTGGLSEENWEEVCNYLCASVNKITIIVHTTPPYLVCKS